MWHRAEFSDKWLWGDFTWEWSKLVKEFGPLDDELSDSIDTMPEVTVEVLEMRVIAIELAEKTYYAALPGEVNLISIYRSHILPTADLIVSWLETGQVPS